MKKILIGLLFLGCLQTTAQAADALALGAVRSVSVSGFAEESFAPDEANVAVTVHSENRDLATAKKEQDEKVKKLVQLAMDTGVKKEDIRTQFANVQPSYDYANGKQRFRHYELNNRVEIKVRDLNKTGPLVDRLVAADFDRMDGIQFSLSTERQKREEMLAKAIENGRAKAESMAAALGQKLGRPISIEESGANVRPPQPVMMMKAERAMAADASVSMPSYSPAGEIQISQTVGLSFELQ